MTKGNFGEASRKCKGDARKQKELEFLEWRVFTIWECQTNSREGIVHLMNTFLDIDL